MTEQELFGGSASRQAARSALSRRAFIGRGATALAATSAAGALLAACGAQPATKKGAGGTDKVAFLNIVPLNMSFAADLLADTNGYFRKEGLDVTFQSTRGSAPAIQSVLAGSALITRAGAIETVIDTSKQGAPLMNVGMIEHKSPLWFVSAKDKPLNTPQDFVGKTMGLPSKGGTSEQTLDLMLSSANVDPQKVKRQVVGLSPGTFELVKQGRIDGYTVGSVDGVVFQKSIPDANLLDPSKYVTEGQVYLVSQQAMEQQRDQVKAYMAAVRRAATDILDDPGHTRTIATLRRKYDFPELKKDALAKAVLDMIGRSWTVEGRENLLTTVPQTWQKVYDETVAVKLAEGGKNPKEWYTNDLIAT